MQPKSVLRKLVDHSWYSGSAFIATPGSATERLTFLAFLIDEHRGLLKSFLRGLMGLG